MFDFSKMGEAMEALGELHTILTDIHEEQKVTNMLLTEIATAIRNEEAEILLTAHTTKAIDEATSHEPIG